MGRNEHVQYLQRSRNSKFCQLEHGGMIDLPNETSQPSFHAIDSAPHFRNLKEDDD